MWKVECKRDRLMVIYERLEIFLSYNVLNILNVCMMVLWRLLSNLLYMGNG